MLELWHYPYLIWNVLKENSALNLGQHDKRYEES